MIKKIISLILLLTIFVSSSCISINAKNVPVYKDIDVYYVEEKAEGTVRMMLQNDNLYVKASFYERFGFSVANVDNGVCIYNPQNKELPQGAVMFTTDSTLCMRVYGNNRLEKYDAPFNTIKNGEGIWIPFLYSMSIFNGCVVPGIDGTIMISSPCQSALDLIHFIDIYKDEYEFDYATDLSYSKFRENILTGLNKVVNRLQGLLTFDGAAWVSAVTGGEHIGLGDYGYDDKYGKNMARLICTNSADELLQQAEEVSVVSEVLSDDGALGKFISEARIKNETDLKELSEAANDMLKKISDGAGDVTEYNRIYQKLEDTLSKSSIIDLGEPILNAQKAVSTGAKGLKLMSVIAETASYVSEFSCRDMYSVNALEKVAKSLPYVKSDVSFYTKVALMDGAVDFKSNALDYSVERFLRENVADIAFDIANVISTKANLILLAWNIASNFIPFLSEGFAAAEKYELSIYAMALQNETYKLYYQKLSEYTSAGQYLTPERVQELSQYAYVYLKTCLIARDAAIGGIHVSKKYKSIAEEVKKDLKGKNDAITPLLSLAKDTANENKKLSTGFLKSHSDSFDELFNDKYIVDIMKDTQTSVPDDSYDEQVNFEYDISLYNYYVELERIEDVSSAYNDGSAFLYDMDRDGAQELVTLTLYHSPEGENMEEFCYSVYDITQDRVVRIDREFLGYNVAGPGGRVGVGTTDDNKMVFYTVYDNGETSSEDGKPKRETEYKIYYIGSDTTNMDFVTTINRKYKGEDTLEILVNGKTGTEDDYRLFTEITPIIEAEIYKNDPSDGSLRLYDMSEYLLNN